MKNVFALRLLLPLLVCYSGFVFSQNFALDFDGINDKVGVAHDDALTPTDQLTLEAWIKAASWPSNEGTIICKHQQSGGDKGYALAAKPNGGAQFNFLIDGWQRIDADPIMSTGTWYHLAGVYDGSSMKIYINGILQNTVNGVTGDIDASTGTLLFGENPQFTGNYFNGVIDEVRIWTVARTEAEIQSTMGVELTGSETGLAGYWKFNEGTGTSTADATGNGNNGTLLNMNSEDWVDGFVVPTNDVGAVFIASPGQIGPDLGNGEVISVEIKNFTAEQISDFDVCYQINGGNTVTEEYTGSLGAFESTIFEFSTTADLDGQSSATIAAWTDLSGDTDPSNDQASETVSPVQQLMIFDDEQHNFASAAQTHYYETSFGDLGGFNQILLHVDLNCPGTGCDPWDQPAHLWAEKDGQLYELARYITPFGVACGGWTFDITDFKSILTGKVTIVSLIQAWGASGWLLDVELEMTAGTSTYDYSKIDILYETNGWVYGDPGISHDLDEKTCTIHQNAESAKIRYTVSGHGQGNTDNAAEFSNMTHHWWVNGTETFSHHLWKTDCGSNDCSPQNGTYTYSRAGWCPGQDVQPEFNDLSGYFTAGQDITLDYVLEDYVNYNNTGYDGNQHTEPYYRIWAYLITFSDDPITIADDLEADDKIRINVHPNPCSGILNIAISEPINDETNIEIYSFYGELIWCKQMSSFSYCTVNMEDRASGIYFVRIVSGGEQYTRSIILQ